MLLTTENRLVHPEQESLRQSHASLSPHPSRRGDRLDLSGKLRLGKEGGCSLLWVCRHIQSCGLEDGEDAGSHGSGDTMLRVLVLRLEGMLGGIVPGTQELGSYDKEDAGGWDLGRKCVV